MYPKTTQGVTCTQNNYDFTCSSLISGTIIIKCTNVMGPHTNDAIGNFIVTQSTTICSGIQVSNFQPYGGSITFTSDASTLYPNTNSLQMIWGNIVLPLAFTSNPIIEVNMLTNIQFTTTSSIVGYASVNSIASLQSITASSSTLVTAQIPLSIAVKDASIKLQMQYLQVKGNTQPITSKIDFLDSSYALQYQLIFPSISVSNNALSASLTISSTEINTFAQYTFTIKIQNVLSSAGFVRFAISKSSLSTTVVCYCDTVAVTPAISDSYIDIGGCLTTSESHIIVIQSVLNPISTASTITISTIQTMQNGYSVDLMSNFVYSTPAFTPGTLAVNYARTGTSSDIVGGYSYLSLTITPKNQIAALGTIKMEIPSEIQFVQQTIQTCSTSYGCSISSVSDGILIFQFSSIVAASQFVIDSITIPIRNPYDTSKTNSFKFTSYDSQGNIIDTISTISGFSVSTRSSFDGAITISSDSTFTNGLSLKGIFTLKTKTPQFYPITLTLKTGDLTISNNPVCTISGATMTSCTKMSSNLINILIEGTGSLQPSTLILTISTIKCKDTMSQSTDFEFSTSSTNGLMSYQKGPSVINTQYGTISQPNLTVDKMYYGATNVNYEFDFTLTNQLTSSDYYLEILCPFTVPSSGVTCKDTSNNQLYCTSPSSNIISITGPFDVNQLTFYIIIGGLPTPSNSQQATTFTIRSYRNINSIPYLVDSSSNGAFIFTVNCPALNNCRTCNIINSSSIQCLTCYSSSVSTFNYMKSQICVDACGDGYYQDETAFTCQQCSTNCKECTKQSGNLACITCFDQYKYQDGLCVTSCGESFYLALSTDSVCSKCDSACMQCSINSSYCSKCQPNIPLYNNKCYASGCESGYYETTNSNQVLICDLCPITCLSCISSALCTQCQLGQYYLSGACISACPSGYYLGDDLYTCESCSPGCDQCSDNSSCVKCKESYLLKGTSCVIACGDNYYADSTNTSCLACDSKCLTCELQDSTIMCNTCADSYYFSNFTCLAACPSNYYANNQKCLECSVNCVTCSGSYNNCTSCEVQAETPLYLAGSTCVSTCPDYYYPDSTSGKCQKCAENCTKCTSAAQCTSCNISATMYYLVEGACRSDCPTNYQPSGLTCAIIPVVTTTQTSPQRFVPVPYLIVLVFLSISVLVSKIHKSETVIPGAWLGLNSICVWGSWITLTIISQEIEYYYFWILVGGVLANYVSNIIHFILVITKIHSDPDFIRWKAASFKNKLSNSVFLSLSLLMTFPSHKMIMSRYFGFTFFKAKMLNIKGFFYFNCLNGISIMVVHIPIIVASCLIAYNEPSYDSQIFISSIDAIIVTIISIMILIWETQKSENFFEEFLQNNYQLNESNPQIEKHEISGFFNNPFEQRNDEQVNECNEEPKLVNQENDVTKQNEQEHSHEHSQDQQSCNIQGISIILSDKHSIFEHTENQFNPQINQTNNCKHTVFYKSEEQQVDPDEEPPQVSPQSDNYSSVKSDHNGHCSFANNSQSPLKDISQIEDSEEQHSQLSIFDEEKNQSPSKQAKYILQKHRESDYNLVECSENNPQIINQQIVSTNLFKKDKSNQASERQSDSLKQLAKSAQFPNEQQQQHQTSQLTQDQQQQSQKQIATQAVDHSQSQKSIDSQPLAHSQSPRTYQALDHSQSKKSIATNKAQQGLLTQQNSLQQPITVSFVKQVQVVQKSNKNEKRIIQNDSDIPLKNTDNVPQLPSNDFLSKARNIDVVEPKIEKTESEPQVVETLQLQVDILDEQPQFEPEEQIITNNIPVLMDSRAIEEQNPFDDSIVFQQVKPYKMKLQGKQTRVKSEKNEVIRENKRLENIFDPKDSIHTMSDQDWGEHQQSPSEFNSQNQRIEEEQDQSLDIKPLPACSRTQGNSRADFDFRKQAKIKPIEFEFDNENNEEQSYVNQTQVNFSNNYQTKQKELEKIYMQKLDKQKFKKKPPKNQPKDLSDAYVHEKVDVEEIDF